MIIGNLPLQGAPKALPSVVRDMLEFFASADAERLPLGKAAFPSIDPGDAYYIVQRYDSRDPAGCFPECHRRFVDVQYIARGREAIGWAPLSAGNPVRAAYDPERDIEFFEAARLERFVSLLEGDYAILGPEDLHRPCCRVEGPESVLKIVGKVRVELFSV